MRRSNLVPRLALASLVLFAVAAPVAAQRPASQFKNLKVLPADISQPHLMEIMRGYTRALGVRCTACHVGQEGQPLSSYDFAADDKPAKRKAREMIQMTYDINSKYLSKLENRSDPAVQVQCATCHGGVREPRQLEDVLVATYDRAGLDSTIINYGALRERYYGREAYDFGEVPLTQVAAHVEAGLRSSDAVRLHALNVEMNPKSPLAKRLHAASTIEHTFLENGTAAGIGAFEDLQSRYGDELVNDAMLTDIAGNMIAKGETYPAIEALTAIAVRNPDSADALVNLGDAYVHAGDKKKANVSYKQALSVDPLNERAKAGVASLKKK